MSQVISGVLYQCDDNCLTILERNARAGFILPDGHGLNPNGLAIIVQREGLSPAPRFFGRCLWEKRNGARKPGESEGPRGNCYLKIERAA